MDEDRYLISTDPQRLDLDRVHHWLSTDTYWARGRSREDVTRAAAGSLNFGAYDPAGRQVAYARVVTDRVSFAWLCDVYVDPAVRGTGVGTRLVTAVREHLAPYRLRRIMLATLDAHGVYARLGFTPLSTPEHFMVLGVDSADPDVAASAVST